MLGRLAVRSVTRSSPQVVLVRNHTEGSKFYTRKKELEEKIMRLEKEVRPQAYQRDEKAVAFVADSYKSLDKSKPLSRYELNS